LFIPSWRGREQKRRGVQGSAGAALTVWVLGLRPQRERARPGSP